MLIAANIPAESNRARAVGSGVTPPLEHRANHGVGHREQHTHRDSEGDDADRGTDVLLHRTAEQLVTMLMTTSGEVRLGVLTFPFVVHRGTDQRLDHHAS